VRGEADDGGRGWKDDYRCFLDIFSSSWFGLWFLLDERLVSWTGERERERERESCELVGYM
jgi:hypothetical protein